MRYRCEHAAEQLALLGVPSRVVKYGEVDLRAAIDSYHAFLLHRVPWDEELEAFVGAARSRGKTVVFDTDDLLLDHELADRLGALQGMSQAVRDSLLERLSRCRQTLRACDMATVSSEPLREFARQFNGRVEVVFNTVSRAMLALADRALRGRRLRPLFPRRRSQRVTVAYLSGSRTHGRDFLEAAGAVLWALKTYPHLRFLAVGDVELDSRFDAFAAQIERLPFQRWQKLPSLLAGVDVNLAPLEKHNPFTACKSCVKYLEAGLLGVPTVASPRPDFLRVIEHGRNGLLADSQTEWRQALGLLIEEADLRLRLGEAAREDVRRRHTTCAQAARAGAILAGA
jgi:glycosyltransferase involved in cell wall biosynthesis